MVTLVYPLKGRGSFTTGSTLGDTLDVKGVKPGSYYRAPATGSTMPMPGRTGALAVRNGTSCDVNNYAVFRAVQALQRAFHTPADGFFGPGTAAAAVLFQKANGLAPDGICGPSTCRAILEPLIVDAAHAQDGAHADVLGKITLGTMSVESGFDPGAVGVDTPQDLGAAQINGPAHPSLSPDARLDPQIAIPWMVGFIDGNLKEFNYNIDTAIAAFNLGRGGAASWVRAGRPEWFHGTNVWSYLARIRASGGL